MQSIDDGLANNTCDSTSEPPMRHNNQRRQEMRRELEYVIPPIKWGQPFVLKTVYSSGDYLLANPNGDMLLIQSMTSAIHDHLTLYL